MAQVLKRENLSVIIDTYQDKQTGQQKHKRRTIGEIVTMQGDDGSVYQFGEIWGPHGCTKFNIYEQQDDAQQAPAQNQSQGYQQQQAYQQAPQQQPYNQPQVYNQAPQPGFQQPSR